MSSPLRIGVKELRELPPPNEQQRTQFLEHVCRAHSWYKGYLTPEARLHMVVFLWRGAAFAQQQRSRSDYHAMYGYLAYGWRFSPGTTFFIDGRDGSVELETPLLDAASAFVEPYVSSRSGSTTECISLYARGRLNEYPRHEALGRLLAYFDEQQQLWGTLTDEIRNAIVKGAPPALPEVVSYQEAERCMEATYEELHREEVAKLDAAIDRVLALRQA